MRWLAISVLVCCLEAQAEINRVWIGDTSQVRIRIVEDDTAFLPKKFGTEPDTFIAYYDVELTRKARWAYRGEYYVDSTWFPNGNLRSWTQWVSDPSCVNMRQWYSNGRSKKRWDCIGDTSTYLEYYPSGQIKTKHLYYRDSSDYLLSWHYIAEYYENGQLKYDPGNPEGPRQTGKNYYPSGKVHYECTRQAGGLVGPLHEWYENGELKVAGQYKIPLSETGHYGTTKTGTWSYYDESGKLIKEEFYEEGKLIRTVEH